MSLRVFPFVPFCIGTYPPFPSSRSTSESNERILSVLWLRDVPWFYVNSPCVSPSVNVGMYRGFFSPPRDPAGRRRNPFLTFFSSEKSESPLSVAIPFLVSGLPLPLDVMMFAGFFRSVRWSSYVTLTVPFHSQLCWGKTQ